MSSRDKILSALKQNRPPFPNAAPRPDAYLPVTEADLADLLGRFKAELEKLTGKVHVCASEAEGIGTITDSLLGHVVNITPQIRSLLFSC
jgi:hypothetical protein